MAETAINVLIGGGLLAGIGWLLWRAWRRWEPGPPSREQLNLPDEQVKGE